MTEAWFAAGVRTPFAKVDGALAAHDAIALSVPVVRHMVEHIIVMRQGEVVEQGPAERVFRSPREDYTRELIAATPRIDGASGRWSRDPADGTGDRSSTILSSHVGRVLIAPCIPHSYGYCSGGRDA